MPGVIKINPDVMNDKRDALAVAWNEALRILMEDIGFTPEFQITPEQEEFFRGTAYAEGEGTSAWDGGNVMVTVGRGEDPQKRLAQAQEIVAKNQALVDKATPWFMRPGKVASGITLRRDQGTDPSGNPVYSEIRPVDQTVNAQPTIVERLQKTLSNLAARASEVVPTLKEAASLTADATVNTTRDISNARQNIERAAGAARGAAMSKAIGAPVEYKMGTPAEAREEYKDIDLGFGKGRIGPEMLKKGDPGYAEALEFNNSILYDRMK